ncbi:MAG: TIGR04283 family arsenosugar biosynthesis glycosyltransferase [Prosthecochloris sp.]|uniref:TIGR04283 family arsenosugar biosynthesis glycosyltransferase n=1 Tax=Prosthecochloris sp. TaxID=290513 RepID=UPI002587D654|nr:TIGR04283 family arsenosugar biosynthesis glycosyltransferase [Prosthecochloris sp.]MCW8798279.1 TIGR04283 family arsenosugar biosynthesis glycosyltransferase [Prosthecochloris sp.]
MKLSIIIPTYNESEHIDHTLSILVSMLKNRKDTEIIVSDASSDSTAAQAAQWPVRVIRSPKGRAVQMNEGAKAASGTILYFLHADTIPSPDFADDIIASVKQGKQCGCFQMNFDDKHWVMQCYGWFTQLPLAICRGGDQSLFVERSLFNAIEGFNTTLRVMEDIDIIERLQRSATFHILPGYVTTSARKYDRNGRFRLQIIFGCMHLFYWLGFDQDIMADFYSRNIS